jgi:hypothetical protein
MQEVHKDVTAEREETQLVRTLKNKSKINKKLVYIYRYFYINIYISINHYKTAYTYYVLLGFHIVYKTIDLS